MHGPMALPEVQQICDVRPERGPDSAPAAAQDDGRIVFLGILSCLVDDSDLGWRSQVHESLEDLLQGRHRALAPGLAGPLDARAFVA